MITKQILQEMKLFKTHCSCGGLYFAFLQQRLDDPHLEWCPQRKEYLKWKEEKEIEHIQTSN